MRSARRRRPSSWPRPKRRHLTRPRGRRRAEIRRRSVSGWTNASAAAAPRSAASPGRLAEIVMSTCTVASSCEQFDGGERKHDEYGEQERDFTGGVVPEDVGEAGDSHDGNPQRNAVAVDPGVPPSACEEAPKRRAGADRSRRRAGEECPCRDEQPEDKHAAT